MFYKQKEIAILVFANSSKEELKHKRIANGEQLFNYFNSQTIDKVRKTNLPFAIYSEKEQHGNTFGERFTNAIEDLFKKGYQKIITIGNDSPNLKASHLIDACNALLENDVVIGPSTDGGIYLMGFHKQNFEKQAFLKLPWQTKKLAKTIISTTFSKGQKIEVQQKLRDIDGFQDLKDFFYNTKNLSETLKSILVRLLTNFSKKIRNKSTFISIYIFKTTFNKGSPNLI